MNILASVLPWLQIIFAVLLVTTILLQQNESSLGSAFGGSSGDFSRAKRGLEKQLFHATIVLALLFVTVSIIVLFI